MFKCLDQTDRLTVTESGGLEDFVFRGVGIGFNFSSRGEESVVDDVSSLCFSPLPCDELCVRTEKKYQITPFNILTSGFLLIPRRRQMYADTFS